MNKNPNIHAAAKRFVARYIRGRKPRRLHTTDHNLSLVDIYHKSQIVSSKPSGLWYGIADSWINWCLSEDFGGIHEYIYDVVIDENKILTIDNIPDFEKFEKDHYDIPGWAKHLHPNWNFNRQFFDSMNYSRVAENFGGIEISPYQWDKRLKSMWYYGWDCASGCIWNPDAIKSLNLFAYYDSNKDEFLKVKKP